MVVRIKFNKTDEAKYISHLDLLRTFNRILLRSGLKPAYSQGYNPHILMAFIQPASVGMETKNDCVDITFEEQYKAEDILDALKSASPKGIEILSVSENPALKFNTLSSASYVVSIDTNGTKDEIIEFLRLDEIYVEKKTKKGIKEVDIKPMFLSYEVEDGIILKLKLKAGSTENLNPLLVVKAMEKYVKNITISNVKITREYLISENGKTF